MSVLTAECQREVRSYRRRSNAAGLARVATREILAGWQVGCLTVDDATLVVSELVGNAIRHTLGHVVTLTLTLRDGRLLVEVWDDAQHVPSAGSAGSESETGRGLMLVTALSVNMGGRAVNGGKVMWAELVCVPQAVLHV